MIERRQFSCGLLATIGGCVLRGPSAFAQGIRDGSEKLEHDMAALEKAAVGRAVASLG